MVNRLLFFLLIFLVAEGLYLHYDIMMPYGLGDWIGRLPGDMWLRKGDLYFFLPLTSAFIPALFFSILFSMLFKTKKEK